MDKREILQIKLTSMFPVDSTRTQVCIELDRYGKEFHEQEIDRVKLGILKIAGTDFDEIKNQVKIAKVDHRDILAYAEYPNQMKKYNEKLSQEEKENLIEIDRKQYEAWISNL